MTKKPSKKVLLSIVPNDETGPPVGIPAHAFALFCLRISDDGNSEIQRTLGDLRSDNPNGAPLSSRDLFRIWSLLSQLLSEDEMLAAPQRKACKAALAALSPGVKN